LDKMLQCTCESSEHVHEVSTTLLVTCLNDSCELQHQQLAA
ncbi:30435_t:CDS:1, partial [Gigaspora margarita]